MVVNILKRMNKRFIVKLMLNDDIVYECGATLIEYNGHRGDSVFLHDNGKKFSFRIIDGETRLIMEIIRFVEDDLYKVLCGSLHG